MPPEENDRARYDALAQSDHDGRLELALQLAEEARRRGDLVRALLWAAEARGQAYLLLKAGLSLSHSHPG